MRWWVFLVLAGCYAPTAPAGAPCAEGRTCPDGLVCETVGGADVCILPGTLGPDAAVDATEGAEQPVPGDRDGDGVLDDEDLCPDVVDDQHDEDHDLIGDACDACPIFDNQGDVDGDALPDPCDPYPESPNRLAVFSGFGVPPNWNVGAGWSFEEDRAVFSQATVSSQFITAPDMLTGTIVAITQVTVDELRMEGGVGVGLGTPVSGVSCGFANVGGMIQLILFDIDAFQSISTLTIPNFNRDLPWAIFLVRDEDDVYQCAATNAMMQYSTPSGTSAQPDSVYPFLVAGNVDAGIDWLMVITSTQ